MSKGLDALKDLKEQFELLGIKSNPYLKIIEKELKEHEQYKAIEEELGIDLVTLFKALKEKVFCKNYRGQIIETISGTIYGECEFIDFDVCGIDNKNIYDIETIVVTTKAYGKTWALTKEELL